MNLFTYNNIPVLFTLNECLQQNDCGRHINDVAVLLFLTFSMTIHAN